MKPKYWIYNNLNKISNKVFGYSIWRIRGQWYIFRETARSDTPRIVSGEVNTFYDLKLKGLTNWVLDIGANIGMFCIPLARENPNCPIIAVEADPITIKDLKRNLELNKVRNVKVLHRAVWSHSGEYVSLHRNKKNSGATFVSSKGYDVRTISLDELLDYCTSVDLLKMDVEGAEYEIFKTWNNLIDVKRGIFELHLAPGLATAHTASDLESKLREKIPDSRFTYAIVPARK